MLPPQLEHSVQDMSWLEKESIMQIFDVEFEATEVLSSPSLARPSPLQNIFELYVQRETIGDPGCSTLPPSP
jgi:hypothetical protein